MSASPPQGRRRADVMMLGLRSLGGGQGGVEAHVDKLVDELDRRGLAVDVIVRTPYSGVGGGRRGRATTIHPVWAPRRTNSEAIVHSALGVLHAVRHRPRILHIHAIGPSLVVPIARALGLRVVVTHHGEDYRREKWGRFARLALRVGEWCGGRFANARIVVSRSLALTLGSRYGRPFHYVPNGVALSTPVQTHAKLTELGLEPGRYVLHVGRLVPEKRQLDLCQAMPLLRHRGIKLVLVGAADHDSGYSRELARCATGSDDIVMAGFQSGTGLAELFGHAAAFVLPSSHEGLPIALLEAMAYGNPVLASDIEANLNIGLPDDCYVPLGDVPAIAAALDATFDRYPGGARADWSDWLTAYRWPHIAERTIEIYRQVDPRCGATSASRADDPPGLRRDEQALSVNGLSARLLTA